MGVKAWYSTRDPRRVCFLLILIFLYKQRAMIHTRARARARARIFFFFERLAMRKIAVDKRQRNRAVGAPSQKPVHRDATM